MSDRISVAKTYKLYIGGKFPRSESGRVYPVTDPKGKFLANAAHASRKDVRDAMVAARKAFGGWSTATAYNRGQVLYRVAEVLEGRRDQFVAEVSASEALPPKKAESIVDAAIDRWVWYAGWTDKLPQVTGTVNPVAGPYFNFTIPEPTGVVGLVAPEEAPLLGLVRRVAPALCGGNVIVALAPESSPLAALTLAEVFATSDVPAGVVNIISGQRKELLPWLASHMDVNAIDVAGCTGDEVKAIEESAAGNVKRVIKFKQQEQSPYLIVAFMEMKTVWHPIGV